ncbi:crossover junction endodeoxyribonuclease RuvC [Hallerella sp.]|uniref:crossover junction endodeoxyribonuclease RuvC n=1 Tax=Hallerella sp. TaxID=2815812 RepID=UPI00258EE5E5|nr:crossover junction endodeoxyribonuclease RuvC [Hallerella sp.]MCI6873413.1 crossover junction endodeoxyribonuclease RuvC [Hallerella sp.]
MIILGVDPGSRTTGYAFLEKRDDDSIRVLEYGTVSAKARDDFPDRLVKIVSGLEELVDHYKPQALSMEGVFSAKNVHSSLVLGHIRGAILVMCRRRGMEFFEYSPRSVKLAVTGDGGASKEKVALLVRSRLGMKQADDVKLDATDALAIACTHLFPQNELMRKTPSRKTSKKKTDQWKDLILKMGGKLPE